MFEGSRKTDEALKILMDSLERSKLTNLKSKKILLSKSTSLYDYLEQTGYKKLTYHASTLDKLASKYKLVRWFHKPHKTTDYRFLLKGDLCIFFDDWHVDIIRDGETLITFGKNNKSEEILNYIINLEREEKLKRILNEK